MSRLQDEVDAAIERIEAGARPADLESATLDFKEEKPGGSDTARMIAEAVVCFANGGGGALVLGVRDKASGPEAFVGTAWTPDEVTQRVHELTQPPLWVEAARHGRHPDVLVVTVPQGTQVHADSRGRATRRIRTDCVPMNPAQIAALEGERRGLDHSGGPSGRSIDEASPEAVATARRMLGQFTDERRHLATASVPDLMAALGASTDRSTLTRAGALLFCEPTDPVPPAVLYTYRETPGGEPRVVQRMPTPLLTAFSRTLELIQARSSSVPLTLKDGQQFSIEDFPLVAVREALSNALVHRDLQLAEPVVVEHSPTVLRVVSPGPLVTGITPSNIITTPSKPRNRTLALIARKLGLAEELGSGVDRMIRAMIGAGRQLPTIEDDASRVTVTLIGGAPNTQIARFVAQLVPRERDDTDTLLLIFHLCHARSVDALTLAPILQRTRDEAAIILRRLAADDVALLEPTRHTASRASPVYRLRGDVIRALSSAVTYNRRTVDEIDRKVVAHVREYGSVSNGTLQNLFDVDVFKARDIIADLAQRGILVRASEAKRGPSVVWGPGPAFPAARRRRGEVSPSDD